MRVQQTIANKMRPMITPLTTRYTFTDDACMLKLAGSIDITNHHLLWSLDAGRIVLQKMLDGFSSLSAGANMFAICLI